MDIILLVAAPFSLVGLVVLTCIRTVSLATRTWWQLVIAFIRFHADLCWKVVACTLAFILLPLRIFTALQRERVLEIHLLAIQSQLETLIWENKELEQRLQKAIKERKVIETIFEEIEGEHEKALSRIDQLEDELRELKEENVRLNEVKGKSSCDRKACDGEGNNVYEGVPLGSNYGIPTLSTALKGTRMILQDLLMTGASWGQGYKMRPQEESLNMKAFSPWISSQNLMVDGALEWGRIVALWRSLFGAILSLLVGMIIWQAQDPCMPLVAALFIVVGMSLSSVVHFFSTINNKPASDAVALLSLNWFILGTLTFPSLPIVTRALVPRATKLAECILIRLGMSP